MSDGEVVGPVGRRKRFADSYGLVLLLLVISYFCAAALGDYTWGRVIVVFVLAAATWLALRASQVQRRAMRVAQALIPVLCVVAVASLLIGQDNVAHAVTGAISLVLVIVAPIAIGWHLARNMALSAETFLGAVCVVGDRLHLLQLRHDHHGGLRRLHLRAAGRQDDGDDGGRLRAALPDHRRLPGRAELGRAPPAATGSRQ